MDDDRLLLASFSDKQLYSSDNCVIAYTKFLDIRQQSLFLTFPKRKDTVSFLFGGYPGAERKIGLFIPAIYGIKNEESYIEYDGGKPLEAVRINKDRFSSLSHRDYLGAIMNCGIKRETVGDIIVDEKGAYAVLFEEVSPYVTDNLFRIGKGTCSIEKTDFSMLSECEPNTDDKFITVASLRLDNVVASAFSLSRKNAVEAIIQKKVFVDGVLCEKPDKTVPVGAKLVLHGKGKALLFEQVGVSRKDRPQVIIKRYI